MTNILGLYCLFTSHPEEGTETIETYDSREKAQEALNAIRKNRFHVAEYDDLEVKTHFEDEDFTFYIDQEVLDEDGQLVDYFCERIARTAQNDKGG